MSQTPKNSTISEAQINEILEALMSFGELNFDNKLDIQGETDHLDAISAAINMLGEELRARIGKINEREIMLREIHHRVKNNMQIISSILNLQASTLKDPDVVAKFIDCKERIASMALVHEQLYQSENLTELEVNSYFAALCKQMEYFHANTNVSIEFISAHKSLYLPMEKVIPLGLMMNELIMNSFKHSFVQQIKGKIKLQLVLKENTFTLILRDDGKGFDNSEDFYNSKSLGLQLVHSLIDQLDASLQFSPRNPYSVSVQLHFDIIPSIQQDFQSF